MVRMDEREMVGGVCEERQKHLVPQPTVHSKAFWTIESGGLPSPSQAIPSRYRSSTNPRSRSDRLRLTTLPSLHSHRTYRR